MRKGKGEFGTREEEEKGKLTACRHSFPSGPSGVPEFPLLFTTIERIEQDEISAIKIEAARIHTSVKFS